MGTMKTPGVYVIEKSAFPNSVVEVATAVPAFVGYTEFALNGSKPLLNKPWRITSFAEFVLYFGSAPKPGFTFKPSDKEGYTISRNDAYSFFYNMSFFFVNGGGPCYIVSVGSYKDGLSQTALVNGIVQLEKEQEPTMIVIPEAVALVYADDCSVVQQKMLQHCGIMQNRIAILDVFEGYKSRDNKNSDVVASFRDKIGTENLMYGASYYPWLNTAISNENDIRFDNISGGLEDFKKMLIIDAPRLKSDIEKIEEDLESKDISEIHKVLNSHSKLYNSVIKQMQEQLNLLPPSAAMAGLYTMVDSTREVWKAPANISLNAVVSPAVNISSAEQEDLNVPLDGKAINAIRNFIGEGVLVWGARTLDGNSFDWRYINVRRTMIMLQESIKLVCKAYVFEPNTANTWVVIRSTISNFLTGIWKRGGLAGSKPEDAFSVHIGLGDTMTPEDILEGIIRITVLVAVSRPAEFIEITFQQQMQKS